MMSCTALAEGLWEIGRSKPAMGGHLCVDLLASLHSVLVLGEQAHNLMVRSRVSISGVNLLRTPVKQHKFAFFMPPKPPAQLINEVCACSELRPMANHTQQGQQGFLALFDLQERQASTAFTGRPRRVRTKGDTEKGL